MVPTIDSRTHAPARARVLVVEDDVDVREALRLLLGDAGYAVATVAHGAAALDLVKQHRPALIFVDLRLPIPLVARLWCSFSARAPLTQD